MGSSVPFKIGLACAGGGIEGAVYEIGTLCALEEAIMGLDFTRMHVYVGVSAGAIVTASLANGISPRQMSLAILSKQHDVHPITPSTFYSPDFREYMRRVGHIPGTVVSMLWDYIRRPGDISLTGSLSRMTELLPTGLFSNDPIRKYMALNFAYEGRTDDFRKLKTNLRLVATDLDSSKSVVFGSPGFDDVPISLAVQASSALPAIYTPVRIKNRYYIDGVAQRTVHASVAMQEGANLTICVNPIVPFEAVQQLADEGELSEQLHGRGLPAVLSQTFRTMIHSRMNVGINRYKQEYAGQDIIVIEPAPDDYRMFFTNVFSFSSRKEICNYAYQATRLWMKQHADELEKTLERNGLMLNRAAISDELKSLYDPRFRNEGERMVADLHITLKKLDRTLENL